MGARFCKQPTVQSCLSPASLTHTSKSMLKTSLLKFDVNNINLRIIVFSGTSEIDLSSPLNYGTPSSRLDVGTPRTPGAVGTPIRPRPDVRSERKMRTVNVGGGGSDPVSLAGCQPKTFWTFSTFFFLDKKPCGGDSCRNYFDLCVNLCFYVALGRCVGPHRILYWPGLSANYVFCLGARKTTLHM